MSHDTIKSSSRRGSRSGETLDEHGDQLRDLMALCETLELYRTSYTIEKPIIRKHISKMMKSIATELSDEYPRVYLNR